MLDGSDATTANPNREAVNTLQWPPRSGGTRCSHGRTSRIHHRRAARLDRRGQRGVGRDLLLLLDGAVLDAEEAKISQAQLSARLGMELLAADLQRPATCPRERRRRSARLRAEPVRNIVALVHHNGTQGKVYARTPRPDRPSTCPNASVNVGSFGRHPVVRQLRQLQRVSGGDGERHGDQAPAAARLSRPDRARRRCGDVNMSLTDTEFARLFPTTPSCVW